MDSFMDFQKFCLPLSFLKEETRKLFSATKSIINFHPNAQRISVGGNSKN